MANLHNHGLLKGRLTSDPSVFDNKDGSKKVKFTLAVARAYKNADGTRTSDFIPVEAFVSKDSNAMNIYNNIKKGDLISVAIEMRSNVYTDKQGKNVYDVFNLITAVQFEESKASVDRRRAAAATENSVEPAIADEEVPFA